MSWRDRNPDERADDIAEAGAVCIDCACVFDASHSARLCPLHAAAPRMLEALREIVRRYDELSTGRTNAHIQFQNEVEPARALLREIHGDPS